jgi:hypothetical protein
MASFVASSVPACNTSNFQTALQWIYATRIHNPRRSLHQGRHIQLGCCNYKDIVKDQARHIQFGYYNYEDTIKDQARVWVL